jgi:hypothetical protein
VVELQRGDAPVVSALRTTSAGLVDEDPLDLAPALSDAILPATAAPLGAS